MQKYMKNKRTGLHYRSDAFAAIHETAVGMYRIGAINKATMQEFDKSCLESKKKKPKRKTTNPQKQLADRVHHDDDGSPEL